MTPSLVAQTGLGETWTALLPPAIRDLAVPPLPGIDCSQCRMIQEGGFHPFARCCNIYPEFPNFLLGEILVEGQREGSPERVGDWIDEGRADPAFAHKSPTMHERHDDANYQHVSDIPPCPLLGDDGRCTVYAQRPHTCIEYNCVYPLYPEIIAFWHTFHSLLGLHSVLTSRYLLHALNHDLADYQDAWLSSDNASLWQNNTLDADFLERIWQGRDRRDFYLACHRYVLEHQDTLHDELETFRRAQLLEQLASPPNDTSEREEQIRTLSMEVIVREPPLALWEKVAVGQHIPFEENVWTLAEFEGFLLWLHRAMLGRYNVLLQGQAPAS